MSSLEAAWSAVHEALPARWRVGPPTFDPGEGHWSVTARSGTRGRGKPPICVSGTGETPEAALRALDDLLRGVPKPDGTKLDELRRRLRLAYVQGAFEGWADMTAEDLERVIARAPGAY